MLHISIYIYLYWQKNQIWKFHVMKKKVLLNILFSDNNINIEFVIDYQLV